MISDPVDNDGVWFYNKKEHMFFLRSFRRAVIFKAGKMRVLEKDVDMLSVSYIGKPPQPRKFKIRFRDGSFRTVKRGSDKEGGQRDS